MFIGWILSKRIYHRYENTSGNHGEILALIFATRSLYRKRRGSQWCGTRALDPALRNLEYLLQCWMTLQPFYLCYISFVFTEKEQCKRGHICADFYQQKTLVLCKLHITCKMCEDLSSKLQPQSRVVTRHFCGSAEVFW